MADVISFQSNGSQKTTKIQDQMRILSIDPGHTTGYVLALAFVLAEQKKIAFDFQFGQWIGMQGLLDICTPPDDLFTPYTIVVTEEYRIYPHKALQHTGSTVYTAREIGRIEWICFTRNLSLHMQSASQAKTQWPNKRLGIHFPHLYRTTKGQKNLHIRDAARHLFTFLETNLNIMFIDESRAI